MNVLVVGGMHGNETLGIEVVQMLQENPVVSVDAIFANSEAIRQNSRFTGRDLNRSFPGDDSDTYEAIRARELLAVCQQYDIVLDFHNTFCPENDCSFVGQDAVGRLFDVSEYLGLQRVIVADYDCMNKYATNCLSIEVSMDSPRNDPKIWYELITTLSQLDTLPTARSIQKFRFVYRMTLEDKERLKLGRYDLRAFQSLPKDLAKAMDLPYPAYPIFIADKFTPYNYGGILAGLEPGILDF